MSNPFDDLSFEEEINPKNWTEEIRLHTPTFEALLKPDGTLWLSGPALAEGFSVEATQALTRFLIEHIKLPPVEPLYDFADFTPMPVDTEEHEQASKSSLEAYKSYTCYECGKPISFSETLFYSEHPYCFEHVPEYRKEEQW